MQKPWQIICLTDLEANCEPGWWISHPPVSWAQKRESGGRVSIFLLIADHQWVLENPRKVAGGLNNPSRRLSVCTHKLRHQQDLPSSKDHAWMLQLAHAFTSEGLGTFQTSIPNVSKNFLILLFFFCSLAIVNLKWCEAQRRGLCPHVHWTEQFIAIRRTELSASTPTAWSYFTSTSIKDLVK